MLSDLEKELEIFRREEEAAQQHFFAYLALHKVPSQDEAALKALNRTPLFWITLRYGAMESAFMALGRIFDENSAHNANRLLNLVGQNLTEFTRANLAARKVAQGLTQAQAAEYAADKHALTVEDVRIMRRKVSEARKIWTDRYRDIRHKIHAHRGLQDKAEEQALYEQTNISEIVSLIALFAALNEAIWQALHNGRKPDLTPKGPEFPIPDRNHRDYPGERVYLETIEALGLLSGNT